MHQSIVDDLSTAELHMESSSRRDSNQAELCPSEGLCHVFSLWERFVAKTSFGWGLKTLHKTAADTARQTLKHKGWDRTGVRNAGLDNYQQKIYFR